MVAPSSSKASTASTDGNFKFSLEAMGWMNSFMSFILECQPELVEGGLIIITGFDKLNLTTFRFGIFKLPRYFNKYLLAKSLFPSKFATHNL